jgi:hypothetical protein
VSVLPEGLIEDGLVQRFLGSAQPHAPLFDRSEVEEVGVDLVGEDGDKEATDGIEEVMVGGGLRESARDIFQMNRKQARYVKSEKSSDLSYSGSRAVPTLGARPTFTYHDDSQNQQGVTEGDHSDRLVRRIKEQGESTRVCSFANVYTVSRDFRGKKRKISAGLHDERVCIHRRQSFRLVQSSSTCISISLNSPRLTSEVQPTSHQAGMRRSAS